MYIILLTYLFYLIYHFDIHCGNKSNSFNKHYYILLFIVIGMAGFGYRMGYDTIKYENAFYGFSDSLAFMNKEIQYNETKEPLWVVLNVFFRSVFTEFYIMKLFIATFVNTTIFWFLRKHSKFFFSCILLYLLMLGWNFNFEILRASIAVAFFLIAFDSLCDETPNYKKYFLCIIPSLFVHWFAFLALLFPLLVNIKPNKLFLIILGLSIAVTPFLVVYSNQFLSSSFFGLLLNERIDTYVNSENWGESGLNLNGILFTLVTKVIPIIFICYQVKNKENSKIVSIALAFAIFSVLRIGLDIFYRITDYFSIITIIVIINYIYDKSIVRVKQIGWLMLSLFMFSILQPLFSYNNYIRYVPYTSIFTEEIVPEREQYYNEFITFPF